MEKFKEALVQFAHSNPSLFPIDAGNHYPMLIEQRFSQFLSDLQTPDHPPYAAMIYRAIWELNKKGGSSEKSISKYIKREYADLPFAHSTLLQHHLEKLCDRKEIHITHKQRYSLGGADSESETKSNGNCEKSKKQKSDSMHPKKFKKREKCQLDIQDDEERIWLRKRKRKQILKCKKKGNKREKKREINADAELQNNEVINGDLHVNSGYGNLDQTEMKENPELQLEESLETDPVLQRNAKRILTSSQLNPISSKLMSWFPNSLQQDKPTFASECTRDKSSGSKDEVVCESKSAVVSGKGQKSVKGKFGGKNGQLKVKGHGRHKITRTMRAVETQVIRLKENKILESLR